MLLKDFFHKIDVPTEIQKYVFDRHGKNISSIDGLSQVNVFVGANNSGKSRLLREIIKYPLSACNFSQNVLDEINTLIIDGVEGIEQKLLKFARISYNFTTGSANDYSFTGQRSGVVFNRDNILLLTEKIQEENYNIHKFIIEIRSLVDKINKSDFDTFRTNVATAIIAESVAFQIKDALKNGFEKLIQNLQKYIPNTNYHRIYIPPLRTLRLFANNINLTNTIAKDYEYHRNNSDFGNPQEIAHYCYRYVEVECGEHFYKTILENLTSGHKNRLKVKEFEDFLTIYFFQNKKVELIPYLNDPKELHIKIGDEKEQPIYKLGDGLQQLIILTWPFFNYESGIIVIEEPELFIHPGLQKRLLQFFTTHDRCANFIFLIATHSNHVIDSIETTDNISIFSIQKVVDGVDTSTEKDPSIIIENIGERNQNALKLLGVTNSSVYLSNCTIWVEGVTDKLYLSKYISEYFKPSNVKIDSRHVGKKLQEGIHYSFVYSGGDNIVHWDFTDNATLDELSKKIVVKYLCGRAMVVVDNDKDKNPKRKRAISDKLGMRFKELPVIEIENLLSRDVIIKTIRSFETCRGIDSNMIPEISRKEINSFRMGTLIEKKFLKNINISGRKKFEAVNESGRTKGGKAVNDKLAFCEKAIHHISHETMSNESIEITKQIIDFILEHNPS